MLGAGQEIVESNHRRVADECNDMAWAIKERKEEDRFFQHPIHF